MKHLLLLVVLILHVKVKGDCLATFPLDIEYELPYCKGIVKVKRKEEEKIMKKKKNDMMMKAE